MHGRDWPFPKKMFAKTATLPPCYCPWQFIDSPGVQTLRENRGNWQIIGPSLPETTNQPDALDNPTPAMYPKTLQSITSVEWPGSSGVSGVSTPGWGPFEPRFGNRCARVIFGIFIKALPENPLQLSRGLASTAFSPYRGKRAPTKNGVCWFSAQKSYHQSGWSFPMITGRCECGKVKYHVDGEITDFSHCHCSQCRRLHGAAFASFAGVPRATFNYDCGESAPQNHYSSRLTRQPDAKPSPTTASTPS
jgi:hypothetical protein